MNSLTKSHELTNFFDISRHLYSCMHIFKKYDYMDNAKLRYTPLTKLSSSFAL